MASAVIEPISPVTAPQPVPWSFAVRALFRFWFCYFCLYALPILLDLPPKSDVIFGFYDQAWKAICPWVATNIFHLSGRVVTYFPTGSGDTTLSYVRQFLFLVVSGVVCIVWSVVDRKRTNYRQLYWWLILIVRYALAAVMLSYGFAKVFPTQFQVPDVGRADRALWRLIAHGCPLVLYGNFTRLHHIRPAVLKRLAACSCCSVALLRSERC